MSRTVGTAVSDEVADAERKPSVGREDLYELLGNCRRRYVIEYLREHEGPTDLDTLTIHVAAQENDIAPEDVTSAQRKRVYTSLQQTHLPRMEEMGAVTFDKEARVVTPTTQLSEFTLHLDIVPKQSVPLSIVYLSLSGLSVLLLVITAAGVVTGVSPFWLGALVLALFALTAVTTHLI